MPGIRFPARGIEYVAALAALIGLIGYVVLDWRFGVDDGVAPAAVGVAFAVLAVGWTVYRRLLVGER